MMARTLSNPLPGSPFDMETPPGSPLVGASFDRDATPPTPPSMTLTTHREATTWGGAGGSAVVPLETQNTYKGKLEGVVSVKGTTTKRQRVDTETNRTTETNTSLRTNDIISSDICELNSQQLPHNASKASKEHELLARVKTLEDEMVVVKKELIYWQKLDEVNSSDKLVYTAEMYSMKSLLEENDKRIGALINDHKPSDAVEKRMDDLHKHIETLETKNTSLETTITNYKELVTTQMSLLREAVNRAFYVQVFGEVEQGPKFCAITEAMLMPSEPVIYVRGIECSCHSFIKAGVGMGLYNAFLTKKAFKCPSCNAPAVFATFTTVQLWTQETVWSGIRSILEIDTRSAIDEKHAKNIEERKKIEYDTNTAPFRHTIDRIQDFVASMSTVSTKETRDDPNMVIAIKSVDIIPSTVTSTVTSAIPSTVPTNVPTSVPTIVPSTVLTTDTDMDTASDPDSLTCHQVCAPEPFLE
jgi:hypothetical protein